MSLSERDRNYLDTMMLVEHVSTALKTVSWIWGGFTADIYRDRILREHDDLDYLTLNLHELKTKFVEVFSGHGWETKSLVNGDLRLKKDGINLWC